MSGGSSMSDWVANEKKNVICARVYNTVEVCLFSATYVRRPTATAIEWHPARVYTYSRW